MTRKDYVLIARVFAMTRPFGKSGSHPDKAEQWRVTRDEMAAMLLRDNGRFDTARFVAATMEGA